MNLSKRINWWSRAYKCGEWICPKELTDEADLISVGNEFVQKNYAYKVYFIS